MDKWLESSIRITKRIIHKSKKKLRSVKQIKQETDFSQYRNLNLLNSFIIRYVRT